MLRYIMICFHAEKGPQNMNCVSSPRNIESRGTPSQFVLHAHKNICANV